MRNPIDIDEVFMELPLPKPGQSITIKHLAEPDTEAMRVLKSSIDEALMHAYGTTDLTHGCEHQWIPYIGLRECYEYCKHCDEKRTITK